MDNILKLIGSPKSLLVHTILFVLCFVLGSLTGNSTILLLILTTAVSLEAIYLSILIQISVNKTNETIQEVSDDIEEITIDDEEYDNTLEEIKTKITLLLKNSERLKRSHDI